MVMEGFPLAYSKDLQEDKELTFDALGQFQVAVAAMTGMIGDLEPMRQPMQAAATSGYITATDLADWLVRVLGFPFRQAHHITGRIVAAAEANGVSLEKLPLAAMQSIEKRITAEVFSVLSARIGEKPHQLWGNGATERTQNGTRVDKAIGKGFGKELKMPSWPWNTRVSEADGCWR